MSEVSCNLPYEELSPEFLSHVETTRMKPGQHSVTGFLAPGEKLQDVYQKDKDYLETVGITYNQIADTLQAIVNHYNQIERQVRNAKSLPPDPEKPNIICSYSMFRNYHMMSQMKLRIGDFWFQQTVYMGAQECPFQSEDDKKYYGHEYGDRDITLTHAETKQKLTFNTILIHLIKKHHFFEGTCPHRIEPKELIEFLGLISVNDPEYVELSFPPIEPDFIEFIRQECNVLANINRMRMWSEVRFVTYNREPN